MRGQWKHVLAVEISAFLMYQLPGCMVSGIKPADARVCQHIHFTSTRHRTLTTTCRQGGLMTWRQMCVGLPPLCNSCLIFMM